MAVKEGRDAINLYYDIGACSDCYGAFAYEHMIKSVGRDLLRDVELFSGDDEATISGEANTYIIAVVGGAEQIEAIQSRRPAIDGPMMRITRGLQALENELLVFDGKFDADGALHPGDDTSVLHQIGALA